MSINFNIGSLFNCFCKSPEKTEMEQYETNFSNFINSLKFHDNKTRISLILQKIVNSHNDLAILYKNKENKGYDIIDVCGNYNPTMINNFNMVSIPIYINCSLEYFIFVGRKTKNKIEIDENLIDLLKGNLN